MNELNYNVSRQKHGIRCRKCRNGLTLVELMVALLLAGMLLTVLMGLVGRISQSNARTMDLEAGNLWLLQLQQQLQSDFENCRFVAQDGSGIRFSGYARPVSIGLAPIQGSTIIGHVPIAVRYTVQPDVDNRTKLIREELLVDLPPPDNRATNLAAIGISGIQIRQRVDTNVAPPILKLEMTFDDGRKPRRFSLVRFGGDANDQ